MSTDIQPYDGHHEVDSWSEIMPQVIKLAEYVQDTEFIPKTLRGRPAAVAAAILSGREMGIGPMRALAHVHMIEGRPSLSAEQKRAAALAAGHEIVYVETGTTRCVVKGRRKGSQEWTTVTWTADDAKNAGLSGRENWRKHPRRMLQARATGELVDLLFPDASAGLATTEELADDTDAVGVTTDGQAPAAKKTARRQTTVKATQATEATHATPAEPSQPSEPPLPGEDGYDMTERAEPKPARSTEHREALRTGDQQATNDKEPSTVDWVTKDQLKNLQTAFTQLGYKQADRVARLKVASTIVGRPLHTANDLTKDEASALIDTLRTCLTERPEDPQGALMSILDAVAAIEGEVVEDEA